ncbi:hypothetical protein RHSIM_Rhsim04G0149100 [Rhododendron simsii]|uniref:Putative plant transposon protein domain-containing protein n=1 Tax=Rhododendron simsii TaxID=118357 RepID=A0A834LMA7_RHOSS|nr:hypothetical protein RHSIM_Rhsim04G0149100 [Rhododendron simsii]
MVCGKGKGIASSSRQESGDDIVEESEHDSMEEDSEEDSAPLESLTGQCEKRRKRRTPEEMEADAKLDWMESIPLRGFKSERQVSRRSFANDNDILILLENQGLRFWTRALLGYNEVGVIEFYHNMDTSEALTNGIIKSKVHNKRIVVDAGAIAKYLRYDRPAWDLVNFLRSEPLDSDVINNALYTTIPSVGVPPHKSGKFKDIYRVLNQVVHYNLYPHGAENKPSKRSAEILYAFMNDAEFKVHWARFIFEQIVDFKGDTFGTARCPHPCMITTFLWENGISKGPYEKLEQPSHGVITKAVLVKSKSQSKAAAAGTSARQSASVPPESSLWSVPNPKASQESIWRKLCCQNIAIWNCIQKEKKERKKLA